VLTDDLLALVQRRWGARQHETKTGTALSTWVFHRQGRPVVDFRDQWGEACGAAKMPGLLFHDLRRSAVRNMDRAGVSQAVAMKVTGHKTDSVYLRYRIVDEADVERALTATQQANRTAPVGGLVDMNAVRNGARP
jgi:integrase